MKRPIVLVTALTLVVLLIWFLRSKAERDIAAAGASVARALGNAEKSTAKKSANETARALTPLEISDLARDLNSPATDIRADLKLLGVVIDTFRSNVRSNPTGTNTEITAALTGKNVFRLALIPPAHAAISAEGELCDRWGRPFFFHQVSGTQMEIRSAGPDKKMWTEDDVVQTP
jgi:hypothetical protein